MIDVQELLRKKENDINRVRKEIHALQLVAPLLSDSDEGHIPPGNGHATVAPVDFEIDSATQDLDEEQPSSEPEPLEGSSDPIPPKGGILRDWFNRAAGE